MKKTLPRNDTFTTYSWRKLDAAFMRSTVSTFAPFLLTAVLIAAAALDGARASDATLFYAPPGPQPMSPVAIERDRLLAKKTPSTPQVPSNTRLRPPIGRICFNHEETRDRIVALKLAAPFRALQVGEQQGEALRAKLCRWKQDQFVYEIAVLRHDGRIVHVYMNAQNGKDVVP